MSHMITPSVVHMFPLANYMFNILSSKSRWKQLLSEARNVLRKGTESMVKCASGMSMNEDRTEIIDKNGNNNFCPLGING